ncbi:NAD-dependent epimerase/dehydratase family protein [Chlamydiota bacterium]
MLKKVLLTGASGFIGRSTIPLLLKKGYSIHAVDISNKPSSIITSNNLFWHKCDLLNQNQQKSLIKEIKPDYLLHFAWYTVPGKYWTSLENHNWVIASSDLLKNFQENGGSRAIIAGTCAEYDWNYDYYSEEKTPLNPRTLYGSCKNDLHHKLSQFSKKTGMSSAWGRIFFLYGPYEAKARLIPSVIRSLLQNQSAKCTHGNQIRDFIHVEDVASAFITLMESNLEGPVNIASGEPITLKTIIYAIADLLGKNHLIELNALSAQENEPLSLVADVSKLNHLLNWKPKITLREGLINTVDWWKHNL